MSTTGARPELQRVSSGSSGAKAGTDHEVCRAVVLHTLSERPLHHQPIIVCAHA